MIGDGDPTNNSGCGPIFWVLVGAALSFTIFLYLLLNASMAK